MQIETNQQISHVWHTLESAPAHQHFNADMLATLPAPVQRYGTLTLIDADGKVLQV